MNKRLITGIIGAALVSCAPAAGETLTRQVGSVAADVEAVAAGVAWRCSTGGPVVRGGDLSGYACEGDGGAGTMAPLSMYRYIRDALDWDFGDAPNGDIVTARVWVIGNNAPDGLNVWVDVDEENEGVCYEGPDGNDRCQSISLRAREAVLEAGTDIAAEILAKFEALKGGK